MKKNMIYGGLLILAFIAISCQKEMQTSQMDKEGFKYTMTISDNEVRSSFTPGTGIGLTGTEKVGVFYKKEDGYYYGSSKSPIKALPDGGSYTFTAPDDLSGSSIYTIMPYSMNMIQGNTTPIANVYLRLSPVQFPGQNTFDPMCDYLFGKPVVAGSEGVIAIPGYKRLFAPLKVEITGLNDSDKIYAVSFSLNQEASGLNSLVGVYRVSLSDDFDQAGLMSPAYGKYPVGNSLSAIYPEGLDKLSDCWPVWFMVNPITLNAGAELSVSVTTAESTFTRNISLPSTSIIEKDKFNTLRINAKGEGFSEKQTVFQHFTAGNYVQANGGKANNLKASDGNYYTWYLTASPINWTAEERDGGSDYVNGLFLYSSRVVKIPESPEGKFITAITAYAHPCSYFNTGTAASLVLNDGAQNKGQISFNYADLDGDEGLYHSAGKRVVVCPEGVENMSAYQILGTNAANMSVCAFALDLEDDPDYTAPESTSILLDFSNLNWPFEGEYASTVGSSFDGTNDKIIITGERAWVTDDGPYEFTSYSSNDMCMNTTNGVRIGKAAGDYLQFPALSGKKLESVTATFGPNPYGPIAIADTDGNIVSGGNAYTPTADSDYTWNLSGTSVNTKYRIMITAAKEMRILKLQLNYVVE